VLLSLDQVWSRLTGDRPALVIVDGVDLLLPYELSVRFLADVMWSASERRAGLTLVSSDVGGVFDSALRVCVLEAGVKVLLQQTATAAELLAHVFHLTPPEQTWLVGAEDGEGLLLAEGGRLPFKAVASAEEKRNAWPEATHERLSNFRAGKRALCTRPTTCASGRASRLDPASWLR